MNIWNKSNLGSGQGIQTSHNTGKGIFSKVVQPKEEMMIEDTTNIKVD